MRRWLTVWGPLIAWCAVIYCLSDRPYFDIEHLWPEKSWAYSYDYPLRKIGHLLEYVVLFWLARRAMPPAQAWAFCAVFAASDEWHQTFVAGRTGRLSDVVLDAAAAVLPMAAAGVNKMFRRR
jgi:VanZ family protein